MNKSNNKNKNYRKDKMDKTKSKKRPDDYKKSGDPNNKVDETINKLKDIPTDKQDVAWYKKFPTLFDYVAKKAWAHRVGDNLPVFGDGNTLTTPSVVVVPYIPSIGQTNQKNDAFNTVARTFWLKLHRLYRGIGTYSYTDLGITLLGLADMYTSIAEAERVYGLLYTYSSINKSVPYTLAQALHIDYDNFGNLSEFGFRINQIIAKMQQLILPKGMSAFDRWISISSRVFKDSESDRATLFMYAKSGYWKYSATTLKGSTLVWTPTMNTDTYNAGSARTATSIIADLEAQFTALTNDSDIARICSDVLAAVAKSEGTDIDNLKSVYKLSPLPLDYTVPFEYNFEWLKQFHNTYLGMEHINGAFSKRIPSAAQPTTPISSAFGLFICQDPSSETIVFEPCKSRVCVGNESGDLPRVTATDTFSGTGDFVQGYPGNTKIPCFTGNIVIDSDKEFPEPDEVMEITRNVNFHYVRKVQYGSTASDVLAAIEIISGSEIFGCAAIYYGYFDPYTKLWVCSGTSFYTLDAYRQVTIENLLMQMDWHFPYFMRLLANQGNLASVYDSEDTASSPLNYNTDTMLMELDNPCVFKAKDLRNLHEAALLSEFVFSLIDDLFIK